MEPVAIATATMYSSTEDLRAKLALRTINEAARNGYPIVVVDGGSPPELLNAFTRAGARVHLEENTGLATLGRARRQAMLAASALGRAVVWMEPEKAPFVPLIEQAAYPVEGMDGDDLVIPSRASLDSYPPEQADAERLGNRAVKYLIGREWDIWFGPVVIGPRALRLFLDYDAFWYGFADMWDSIHVPRFEMLRTGLVISTVEVDYVHPREQTEAETGDLDMLEKRIHQLKNLVPALRQVTEQLGLSPANA